MKVYIIISVFFFGIIHSIAAQSYWQPVQGTLVSGRIEDISFVNDSLGFYGAFYYDAVLDSQVTVIYKTTDKGDTWNPIYTTSAKSIRSIEFINDSIGYFGTLASGNTPGGLYKTTDGGYSWSEITNMQMSPSDGVCGLSHFGNRIVAVGTYAGPPCVYISDDLGNTWTKTILTSLSDGLVECHMISLDTILVSGISEPASQAKGTIIKSNDGGLTWQRVFLATHISAFNFSYCWKLFFTSTGIGLSSIEFGSGIARSTDFGNTWTEIIINNPSANNLGAIGLVNDTLGYATDQHSSGTIYTTDAGLTWDTTTTTIINSGNRLLVVDSTTAFISGRSIYKFNSNPTSLEDYNPDEKFSQSINIFPNPSYDKIKIQLNTRLNTFGILDILNNNGDLVKRISRQPFYKGSNEIEISIEDLASGTYYILWRNNEKFLGEKFIKIK